LYPPDQRLDSEWRVGSAVSPGAFIDPGSVPAKPRFWHFFIEIACQGRWRAGHISI